jgi:hypothetical protein
MVGRDPVASNQEEEHVEKKRNCNLMTDSQEYRITRQGMKELSAKLVEANADRGRTYDNSPDYQETMEIIAAHCQPAPEWTEFLVKEMCSLCAQVGIIDTRGIRTPANFECGGLHYCICPNGRALKEQNADKEAWLKLQASHCEAAESIIKFVEWINEDELPEGYPYNAMYQHSKLGHDGLGGVRVFPAVPGTAEAAKPVECQAQPTEPLAKSSNAPQDRK